MSVLLYGVGALAVMAGAVMIGIGVPVNEFSFGNTMILAGTTTMVGGLIIVAVGVAVAQLQRIAETLAHRAPPQGRASRPPDMFEPVAPATPPRAGAVPTRVPFPPKPKLDAAPREVPLAPEPRFEPPAAAEPDGPPSDAAPTLHNPYQPPSTVEDDDVAVSPQQPEAEPEPDFFDRPPVREDERLRENEARDEPALDDSWKLPPPPPQEPPRSRATTPKSYFDAMWPAEPKRPVPEPEPLAEAPQVAAVSDEPEPAPEPEIAEPERRNVEILKSGVVDGMSYTLYVDGSIDAELPQGTLHFASINDLRDHLERNA